LEAATNSDVTVVLVGSANGQESEGFDRCHMKLTSYHLKLIDALIEKTDNLGVILTSGTPIELPFADRVKAILLLGLSGQAGGAACARVLTGKVNPSGKLPFAIAQKESDYPDIKWNTKAQHYGYYHGYHKLDKEQKPCDYPFGFGLSYTTFRVGQPELIEVGDGHAQIAVSVANTGSRAGAEVVQLYASFPDSPADRPARTLCGFQKVFLQPGEEKIVTVTVNKQDLMRYDETEKQFVYDPGCRIYIGTDHRNLEGFVLL